MEFETLGIPSSGEYLWEWFWQLESSRQGEMGAQAFTYQEIVAWASLLDERPRPWEVEALKAVDRARRETLSSLDGGDSKPPLTGDTFDGVFG